MKASKQQRGDSSSSAGVVVSRLCCCCAVAAALAAAALGRHDGLSAAAGALLQSLRAATAAGGPAAATAADAAADAWRPACPRLVEARREMTEEEVEAVAAQLGVDPATYCPAILYTFTGTGNTMTRMLVEVASGWLTGSVYTDLSLVPVLPGEPLCGRTQIAVKAHPQWHKAAGISADGIRPEVQGVPPDAKPLCVCRSFDRAVALVRDPYATLLAEYQRARTHDYAACSEATAGSTSAECGAGGHAQVLTRAEFDRPDFRAAVLRLAAEWRDMFGEYDAFAAAHGRADGSSSSGSSSGRGFGRGLFNMTFEALVGEATRARALGDLLAALGVPPHHPTGSDTNGGDNNGGDGSALRGYDAERLACAFDAARHPHIYRPKHPGAVDGAFAWGADPQLVCDVWRVVGARAAAFGYAPYGGASCGTAAAA